MAGNERKENYRRPYRNPRYKGHNEMQQKQRKK